MSYRRFDFEKNNPIFRTPKYTGITLSLLSIFVLVCMLSVWEKIPRGDSLKKIDAWVFTDAFTPVSRAVKEFENEVGTLVTLHQVTKQNIVEQRLPSAIQPNLLIFLESQKNLPAAIFQNNFSTIRLAYRGTNSDRDSSLVAWVCESQSTSPDAFQLARFLSAPTRGQFQFARSGWVGVDGDNWSERPVVKIFIEEPIYDEVIPVLKSFEELENISIDTKAYSSEDLKKVLRITSGTDSVNFLPDLIWFRSPLDSNFSQNIAYQALFNEASELGYPCYLSEWSKLKNLCNRLYYFYKRPAN